MALYLAYNSALSTTTTIAAGTSYTTGAKVALQLGIPANGYIDLVEWGISFDEDGTTNAAVNAALVEVASTATATTGLTAHTTTTVNALDNAALNNGALSRLTMGTAATGFGVVAITSNTTLAMGDRQYVQQTGQYVKIYPEGRYPRFGNTAARFLQFRLNTTATVNSIVYAVWDEHIN
jgi:hypothetical protein